MKYVLSLPDMTCGHCEKRVSDALNGKVASFAIDLPSHQVTVETDDLPSVIALLDEAGYDAQEVAQ